MRSCLPLVPLLLFFQVGICQAAGFEDVDQNLVEVSTSFPWSDHPVQINYSSSCCSFVYGSSSWPWGKQAHGSDSFFLYYERELLDGLAASIKDMKSRGRDVYVVLDPDPPADNCTFVDLYYDEGLRLDLVGCLDDAIMNLSTIGVDGFVLGDEWPRGLNMEEITVHALAKHNQTYHDETGLWMRGEPQMGEKKQLAVWFYEWSIQAWNWMAREIRRRHPEAHLGTNIDLAWQPDLSGLNVAHWKPYHWWLQVDLTPYDFVVTHYFTRMDYKESENTTWPEPSYIDIQSLARFEEALERLLNQNPEVGLKIFLLLGAHCVYPYVTTPMQMIQEWNLAMKYSNRLAGVGWFIFDLWISNDGKSIESISIADTIIHTPMKMDRLLALRVLLESPFSRANKARTPGPNPVAVEMVWRKTLSNDDEGVAGIISDDAGGVVIVGTKQGSDGLGDEYLLKLDDEGDFIWEGTYGDYGRESARAVVLCQDGGFALAGCSIPPGSDDCDFYLVRVDEQGEMIWDRAYDVGGWDEASCIVGTGDGSLVMFGTISYNSGGRDICLLRVDAEGDRIWDRVYDQHYGEVVRCVVEGNNGFWVVGETWLEGGDSDILVMKIDGYGNIVWRKTYGAGGMDSAYCAIRADDACIVIGGRGARDGNEGPYLLVLDHDGNVVCEKFYQWEGDAIRGIVRRLDGGYWAIGRGGSMLKVDDYWEVIWDTCWEPVGPEAAISSSGDGSYVVVGDLYGSIHAVKLREPVRELNAFVACVLLVVLLNRNHGLKISKRLSPLTNFVRESIRSIPLRILSTWDSSLYSVFIS